MSDDAKSLLAIQAKLADKRSNFDTWWNDIALRVMPAQATFTHIGEDGEKRHERLFSSKPVIANERFAAIMDELHTPQTQEWHGLAPEDEDLAEAHDTKLYLERLTKLLFAVRYRPEANYAAQMNQGYLSDGAFGNDCTFIDEQVGVGPRYRHLPMQEVFWSMNHQGVIDSVYRKFRLEAQQAVKAEKDLKWDLPGKIIETANGKDPMQEFDFLHCVKPNDDFAYGRQDFRGMPHQSFYLSCDPLKVISTGGYREWPFAIGRYMVHGRESYGRSPAMSAWPGILTLNEEKKTVLRAGQLETWPPTLLVEEGALTPFNMRSGALNPGLVSAQGQPLALPFKTGANIPLGMELMAIEAQEIEDAFLTSIFKMIEQEKVLTATQVLELAQQKATLLAPMMGRQHSEKFGPQIVREIGILSRQSRYAWIVEEMPDELRERMGNYRIVYRSPLARAMRAKDGVAIIRTLEVLPAALALDQDAAEVVDVSAAVRELADINGMPAKLLRSPEDVEERLAAKREAEAVAQMAAVAPDMSQAALNAAKAEQLRTPAATAA